MKLEKIIIFYPSFERGGVELILANLINFFLKKKVCICLISSNFNKKILVGEPSKNTIVFMFYFW